MRVNSRWIVAALGLAGLLAGCAPGSVLDQLPSDIGGLPRSAPERPVTLYDYPAVHDMPAPRPTRTLTEEEQVKLENDLLKVRNQQEGHPAPARKPIPVINTLPPNAARRSDGTQPKP